MASVCRAVLRNINLVANRRCMSSQALIFRSYGDPREVVEMADITKDVVGKEPQNDEVLVEFMACPINPADINTIQGVYSVKPPLPAVAGNEGVAKVVKVGTSVQQLKPGDWVIPTLGGFGTWRTHAIAKESIFTMIDNTVDIFCAAQLSVNPCTAYRMLKDYVPLKKGDTVIQNGANSGVGVNVIQLAREWGIKTINVVRSRPTLDKLKRQLTEIGANYVVTEEDLRKAEVMDKIWEEVPKPNLALNCIGGKNATDCMRHLAQGGTMVTYGGMSKQPVIIPTGALIFKEQKFVGYWMTRWGKDNANSPERREMINYLCNSFKKGTLRAPTIIPMELKDYKNALKTAMSDYVGGKLVFTIS